jgi:hypothetical protein
MYYPLVRASSAKSWAAETVVEHAPTAMRDLVGSLGCYASTAKGSRPRLHYAPSIDSPHRTFHVTLILAHFLTDARGAMKIFNHILQYLKAPTTDAFPWGDEVVRLSVPLSIATGRRAMKAGEVQPIPQAHLETFVQGMTMMTANSLPRYTKSPGDFAKPRPGRDIIRDLRLSVSDTTALLQACRARRVTVTSVLNVLIVMAWVKDPAALAGYKTVGFPQFPIDKSKDLLEPYKGGVGLNISIVSFLFDARVIESCLQSGIGRFPAIWKAAKLAKAQIAENIVNQSICSVAIQDTETTVGE